MEAGATEAALERPANQARIARVHRVNVVANLGLASSKVFVGWLAGSPALVAHGAENCGDLLGLGMAWLGNRVARRPPDEDHHYGHHNAEAIAASAIGLLILVGGLTIVYRAVFEPSATEPGGFGGWAVALAALSVVVCWQVSTYTGKAAQALSSQVLRALARDKRADALTSVVVLLGVLGSRLGLSWAEPPVTALVGVLVCLMGGRSVLEGMDVLMVRAVDPDLRHAVRTSAAAVSGVRGVQAVRIHPLGSTLRVDMEISVDGSLTVVEGHRIAHEVERAVTHEHDRVVQVQVHVNPG